MRMMIGLMAIVGLAACSWYDRRVGSSLTPTDSGFIYEAYANPLHTVDDPDAEARRLRWLDEHLEMNPDVCPSGYDIVDRTTVKHAEAILGDLHRVIYQGRCTGS